MIVVDVAIKGPLFSGKWDTLVNDMLDDIMYYVGAQALSEVHDVLNANIKRPTPYYETQIDLTKVGETYVVDDRGVIYGPWLEGTSQRNNTTKFKGYAAFRKSAQKLNGSRRVTEIVARVVAEFIARIS